MASNMGPVVKGEVTRLIELIEPNHRAIILLMNHKDKADISQLKILGVDKVVMGGMKMKMIRKKYKDTRISQESDSHEESDTEDSYEFEITSQQLSQVTPGGGALKIKLSKKKPLKITAGAPDGQSQTIPMELECIPSFKRPDSRSQVDTTSESTLPTRGSGAPLFIPPIHPENNVRPQKGTSAKRGNT